MAFGELVGQIESVLRKKLTDEDGNPLVEGQEHRYVAEQAHQFDVDKLDIRSPQRKVEVDKIHANLWPAVEAAIDAKEPTTQFDEAGRRTPQRRVADGQGLCRRQARDFGGRQDGRAPRKQGRHRQNSPQGGHAVPGGRDARADTVESARRAQPYERRPDSGNAPRLGRCDAGLPGHHADLRRGKRRGHSQRSRRGRVAGTRQSAALRRAHR